MKIYSFRSILWLMPLLITQLCVEAQTTPAPAATTTTTTPAPKRTKKPAVKREKYAIDFDLGFAYPINTQFSSVFTGGMDLSLGFKMAFLRQKNLWVRPEGGFQIYTKDAQLGDESLQEVNRNWKAGLEVQYRAKETGKWSFFPVIRVDYNWFSNQFGKQTDDQATNTRTIENTDKILWANDISFAAGIMIVRSRSIYVKLDYEYFKPTLKVNPDLVKTMAQQGIIMADSQQMDLSTANIKVGFNLNFKH